MRRYKNDETVLFICIMHHVMKSGHKSVLQDNPVVPLFSLTKRSVASRDVSGTCARAAVIESRNQHDVCILMTSPTLASTPSCSVKRSDNSFFKLWFDIEEDCLIFSGTVHFSNSIFILRVVLFYQTIKCVKTNL